MKILTVLKRYNKIFAFIATVTIIAIYLVITLSGKYLKDRIYHDNIEKQPVNNIKAIEEDIFSYVFSEEQSIGNYIYLINQFPIADEIGKKLEGKYKTFDFKLEFNESSVGMKYYITLEKMKETDLQEDWVKVYLVNEGKDIANCIRNTGRIKTYNEYAKYQDKKDEIILYSGTITEEEAKRGHKDYVFRMWISEDVKVINHDYEKRSFIARVNVYANGEL